MRRHVRPIGPPAWVACGFLVWLAVVASARAGAPPPSLTSTAAPQPAQRPATASYVGEGTCLGCHDEQKRGYYGSPHQRAADPRTPAAGQGCESCHGPGSNHVEDPSANPVRRFSQLPPDAANAACTTCHNRGDHALWDGSQHESRNLACTSCHGVHEYQSAVGQLKKKTELELCASCHRDKIAKLDRSGHMPLREGKMQCSTCHNPHGATNVRLLKKGDSLAEMCTSCHADKRGPYLWEHAPTRDGCAACHDPHGSSNERMLVAKPPILCQRCHIATRHPSTIYDAGLIGSGSSPSVRIYARSCVTCHSAIHGSNHPSGQRFVR